MNGGRGGTCGRSGWAARPIATGAPCADACGMQHPELLPAICAAIAVEIAHLRWILLNQWKCGSCAEAHLHCSCKPRWVRALL
jgi:hypothetical protein